MNKKNEAMMPINVPEAYCSKEIEIKLRIPRITAQNSSLMQTFKYSPLHKMIEVT